MRSSTEASVETALYATTKTPTRISPLACHVPELERGNCEGTSQDSRQRGICLGRDVPSSLTSPGQMPPASAGGRLQIWADRPIAERIAAVVHSTYGRAADRGPSGVVQRRRARGLRDVRRAHLRDAARRAGLLLPGLRGDRD